MATTTNTQTGLSRERKTSHESLHCILVFGLCNGFMYRFVPNDLFIQRDLCAVDFEFIRKYRHSYQFVFGRSTWSSATINQVTRARAIENYSIVKWTIVNINWCEIQWLTFPSRTPVLALSRSLENLVFNLTKEIRVESFLLLRPDGTLNDGM